MAKQGNGGQTPPPDGKNPSGSDIVEVVPEVEPAPPKKRPKNPAAETQTGEINVAEDVDLVEEVDLIEEAAPEAGTPAAKLAQTEAAIDDVKGHAPPPVPEHAADVEDILVEEVDAVEEVVPEIEPFPELEPTGTKTEEVGGHAPPPAPERAAAVEDVHEVDLWEDEPAEVEVVSEEEKKKPVEAVPPGMKTPPDDVAGADDFVEIIDPAATLTATSPPADLPDEDLLIDVTPGPQTAPTGKGEVAARSDKIAEALESGTDLTGERQALQPPPVKAPEVDYDSDLDKSGESSAIDLGKPAPTKEHDKAGASANLLAAALAEAAVEPKAFVEKSQGLSEEEPVEIVAAEEEQPPAKVEKAAKDLKVRPERKPGFGLRWVAGILIGILLGGGAAAALSFTGLLGPGEKKGPPVVAGPKVTLSQQAHTAVDRGEYDEAIQLLQGADPSSPEELAVRGEARWLKYLKEQKEKKAPLSAKDELVQQALADLKGAKDEIRQEQIRLALRTDTAGPAQKQLLQAQATLAAVRKQLESADPKGVPVPDPVKGTQELVRTVQQNRQILEGLKKVLADNKQLPPGKQIDPKLLAAQLNSLAAAQKELNAVEALLKVKGNQVAQNVSQLLDARKEMGSNLELIDKQLAQAKVAGTGAKGVQELVAAKVKLEGDRAQLDNVVQQALKELEAGKVVPPGATAKDLVAGIKAARLQVDSPLAAPLAKGVGLLAEAGELASRWLQQNAKNTLAETELAFYRLREPLIKTPEKRLDSWIATLRSGPPATPADLDEARRDAEWVLARSGKRSPELKLKAEFVQALVAKDRGGSAQARALLDRIVKEAAGLKPAPAWVADARQVQEHFTDANSYYVPAARELVAQGRWKDALAKLDEGISVLPESGRLRALRSEVRLQLSGALNKDEAAKARVEARKEAEAATKDADSAAEAYFTLGRIDEASGDLAKAEDHYRQAIKSSQGPSQNAGRYRTALARVILMRMDASPVEVPAPKEQKTGRLTRPASLDPLLAVLTGIVGGVENQSEDKRLQEALDLANELLKSENREDKGNAHLILGKVYTIQGKRTEGLKEYIVGLQLLYPGLETKDLSRILDEHPAFQQPDSLARPNVSVATEHYARGLQRFWGRQYPQAEQELKQAVAYFPEDARYRYFLGLARYQQNSKAKREAAVFDFEQAARLERQNRPDPVAVNSSFERLPFALRQMLSYYRQKTPVPPDEEVTGR